MKLLITSIILLVLSIITVGISITIRTDNVNHKTVTVYHTNVITNTISDMDLINSRLNNEIHQEIELTFKQLIDEEEVRHLKSKETDSFVPITNGTVLFSGIYNKSFKLEEDTWEMRVYALCSNKIKAEIIAVGNQMWDREHIEDLKEKSK